MADIFWVSIAMILAIFDLQVTRMLPTKLRVNWPFGSGEEPNSTPMPPTQFRVNWPFGSREEAKIDFPNGGHGVGFPIRPILISFDLHVTPMLPTKFRVNWPRGVGGVGVYSNCWRRTTHNRRRTTDDGHWLTTIAHWALCDLCDQEESSLAACDLYSLQAVQRGMNGNFAILGACTGWSTSLLITQVLL